MSEISSPAGSVLTVKKLLELNDEHNDLKIPDYQRPYKWTVENVRQLFTDILKFQDKSAYRLGTIVFHKDENRWMNIVDGQQRILTLLLTVKALCRDERLNKIKAEKLKKQLLELKENMFCPSFKSDISKANLRTNFQEIRRIIDRPNFTDAQIDFLLNKCEVVTFTLTDLSEAFQFFDSQNARGRGLKPHDLLKAFHLREFSPSDEPQKVKLVQAWEKYSTSDLNRFFSNYWFRIRNWSKGKSARNFTNRDIDLFKGVNLDADTQYPYMQPLSMVNSAVERYPFLLDQTIINGRRFFEMSLHYLVILTKYQKDKLIDTKLDGCAGDNQKEKSELIDTKLDGCAGDNQKEKSELIDINKLDGFAPEILQTLENYIHRNRTGDRYVRTMFDCLLIYYIDKFGLNEISRAIEKIFIWSYSLRLKQDTVQLASVDNYVLRNNLNLFITAKEAIRPADFINVDLPPIAKKQEKDDNQEKDDKHPTLEALFKKMNYYA